MELYTRFILSTTTATIFRIDRFSVTVSPNIGDAGLLGYHILVVNNTTGVTYEMDQTFVCQFDHLLKSNVMVSLGKDIHFLANDYDGLYTFNISFGRYKERKLIGSHKVNVMKDYYMAINYASKEYNLKPNIIAMLAQ